MADKHVNNRIHVRRLLLAGAVLGVSLSAHAVNSGNIGKAGITRGTGGTTSLSAPPQPNAGGSTIPVSPTIGGWSAAGNYGFPTGPTSPTIGHTINGEFVVGGSGVKYPFQAKYPVDWKGMAGEAGKVMGTLGCSLVSSGIVTAACMVAVPYIWDWITKSGGRANPTTGQFERNVTPAGCPPTGLTNCFVYSHTNPNGGAVLTANSVPELCAIYIAQYNIFKKVTNYGISSTRGDGTSNGYCFVSQNGVPAYEEPTIGSASRTNPGPSWLPSSMDDIAPYMSGLFPDGRIAGEVLSNGGEVPLGTPTVTGPTTLQGPETTKQNADGTKEVSRTTYNFSTAGNTITNTSSITTTNNYNAAGAVTNTTTTTTNNTGAAAPAGESEPPPTQCDKFPDSLGCAKLDVPTQEIPKENKTVTFTEENPFGSGACPANVMWNSHTLGGPSVKLVDWATFCGMALPLRALVIALASIMAFFIIMPGGVRE